MIVIDGTTYNIPVIGLRRSVTFEEKYNIRTENGDTQRELLGTYYRYELSFGASGDVEEYRALWDALAEAVEFHTVTVPGANFSYTFEAYFGDVSDELVVQTATRNYWRGLTVVFTARSPAKTEAVG